MESRNDGPGCFLFGLTLGAVLAMLLLYCGIRARGAEREPAWINFPPQKQTTLKGILGDIESHLPAKYGSQYSSPDHVTHAHETTHGINAHIRNQHQGGQRVNAFYCLKDRAIILHEPNVRLSIIASLVPAKLRSSRYQLYLVQQQRYFEGESLYLLDEWSSYLNGIEAGLESPPNSFGASDPAVAPLEFTVFSLALIKGIHQYDPGYFDKNPQFKTFLRYQINRSLAAWEQARRVPAFAFKNSVLDNLRSSEGQNLVGWGEWFFGKEFMERVK
jgi:hypothetical protein